MKRMSYQRDMNNYPDHITPHMCYIVYGKSRSHLYVVKSMYFLVLNSHTRRLSIMKINKK